MVSVSSWCPMFIGIRIQFFFFYSFIYFLIVLLNMSVHDNDKCESSLHRCIRDIMVNIIRNILTELIWFGWVIWHINHCRLFNAKSSLYIYIRYIWFGLVGLYGISTIVGYLMPNPLYTYILDIYDLVSFCLVLWHINRCRLFNAKSVLYIYIRYMIWFH